MLSNNNKTTTTYFVMYLAKPRTDYLKRSFSYSGALLWNESFKKEIHKVTFISDFHATIMKSS